METWKNIPGFDYQVSSLGRVRSNERKVKTKGGAFRVAPPTVRSQIETTQGYRQVVLHKAGKRYRFSVHRLVLIVFVGEPPSLEHQANHKNGKKNDNRPENLEWVTRVENMQHALKFLGWKHYPGEKNPACKLSDKDVEKIRGLKGKHPQSFIAKMFGVCQTQISRIQRGVQRKEV